MRVRPITGVGVGLRYEFAAELPHTQRTVDWVELNPENWFGLGGHYRSVLDQITERWPVIPHGLNLSIGGIDPLDEEWIAANHEFARRVGAPFWSDHLCYSMAGGALAQELMPLPFSEEAVDHVVARIAEVRRRTDVPLALENITFYARMPGGTFDEPDFVRAVVERSGCGLLLDVNNVYVNARNHGGDPYAALDRMPLANVWQIHLAGHELRDDLVVDTHVGPICDEVWALYRYALARAGRMIPTLVEWDQRIPGLDAVLDEVDRAREHASAALGARTSAAP